MPFPRIPSLPDFLNKGPRFGELLREYRTLRGVSVEDLAAAVDITPDAIREMEAGTRKAPSEAIAAKMAKALRLGGDDRDALVDAAEMESPIMNALFGRSQQPAKAEMAAAILVFMIADVRGYTHFTQQFGDEAAARLSGRFAEMARAALEAVGGRLVEVRGDEVLGVFASARQALRAAHDLQARYADEVKMLPHLPSGIGIGLDIGEAIPVEDGYRGAALNRAARLCSLAGPGETLISTGVVYVAPHVEGVTFVARGQERLKGFDGLVPILLAAPSDVAGVSAAIEAGSVTMREPDDLE